MVLVFLFMAGYYFLDAPSQRIPESETEISVQNADLRKIAECVAGEHGAVVNDLAFPDSCVERFGINDFIVCVNDAGSVIKCEIVGNKKPKYSFIVTSTSSVTGFEAGTMLDILEKNFKDAGTFGIFQEDAILTGAGDKRIVPKPIVREAELTDGQLVFMTQYEIPDIERELYGTSAPDIVCDPGSVKVFRFGRWQCSRQNEKISCNGDMIWDAYSGECIPNDARRPLCGARQSAVMVDDMWECVDPMQTVTCEPGTTARLNYETLYWECIPDIGNDQALNKCASNRRADFGSSSSTIRVYSYTNNCTDCEENVTDPETCESFCIPAPAKLNDDKCYPKSASCSGYNQAFYFGFPSAGYISNVSAVGDMDVPLGTDYSQNRRFNCKDCGDAGIDESKSKPPFVVVCNQQ